MMLGCTRGLRVCLGAVVAVVAAVAAAVNQAVVPHHAHDGHAHVDAHGVQTDEAEERNVGQQPSLGAQTGNWNNNIII